MSELIFFAVFVRRNFRLLLQKYQVRVVRPVFTEYILKNAFVLGVTEESLLLAALDSR
jgi:hypothetical protein